MQLEDRPNTAGMPAETGQRLPLAIWSLGGAGLAMGAVLVGLISYAYLDITVEEERATREHRALADIATELRTPLRQLQRHVDRALDPSVTEPVPVNTAGVLAALDLPEVETMPEVVDAQLAGLRRGLRRATDQLQQCGAWRQQQQVASRRRETARTAAEVSVATLRATVDGYRRETDARREVLLATLSRGPSTELAATFASDAALLRVRDVLDQAAQQVLALVGEPQPRLRKATDRVGRVLLALDAAVAAVAEVPGAEDWHAALVHGAARVRADLVGGVGLGAGERHRIGLARHHAEWLESQAQGEQLAAQTAAQVAEVRQTGAVLEHLLAQSALAAITLQQARTGKVWSVYIALAGVLAACFLLGVRLVATRARRDVRGLVEARATADEAVRAQGLFLASMSHEIRTPMNGVLGMAELLESSDITDEQRQFARTIRSSAEALLTVINDILDFSKIQAGKLELDHTDFDLRSTVEDTLELLGHLASTKNLELLCFIDHRVPRMVNGDPDRLRQVLLNLTGNAIKFTTEGEVTVLVDMTSEHRDVVRLQFSITDTGVGISAEAQSRLFQPFSQADSSTARRFGGTGLGLTISKRLIQLMGGDIAVRSTPGVGSTFSFTLTLQHGTSAQPRDEPHDFSGLSALVVDDNVTNREILAMRLAGWRMGFDLATSGPQALELMRQARRHGHTFDVVLVDLRMPGMDGLDLARQIHEDAELTATRCVLLSSAGHQPEGESLEQLHLAAWLRKPVQEGRLRHCLLQVLELGRPSAAAAGEDDRLNCRILVAEDNAINQRVLMQMLARLGADATFVGDGEAVVATLRAASPDQPFDLILMDCQMPVVDGYEATRRIRQLPAPLRDVSIIALTANVMPADRRACMDAGMNDFLSKPIKTGDLRDAIQRWLPTPVEA